MCVLWITTYTLILIGTVKYRYPLISPLAQGVIAPFEIMIAVLFAISGSLNLDYVSIAYTYWALIEIAIIVAILKLRFIPKRKILLYVAFVICVFAVLIYGVAIREQILLFSYVNTFIGVALWLSHILRHEYPMNGFTLIIFIIKFVADILAGIIYYGSGSWLVDILCVLLPILHFAFLVIWICRKKQKSIQKAEMLPHSGAGHDKNPASRKETRYETTT